jgi:F0F1-type ATP synthase gamma subunit
VSIVGRSDALPRTPGYRSARMHEYEAGTIDAVYVLFNRFKNVAERCRSRSCRSSTGARAGRSRCQARGLQAACLFEPTSEEVLGNMLRPMSALIAARCSSRLLPSRARRTA